MNISLANIHTYIPERNIRVKTALSELDLKLQEAKIYTRIYGLNTLCKETEKSFLEFLCAPARELLAQNSVKLEKIHYLIYTHTAKNVSPFGCALVQQLKQQLHLDNACAFALSISNCAATLLSLDLLNKLLTNGKQALIVCGDLTFTPYLQLIPHATLMGDASAAILVTSTATKNTLIATASEIDGKYAAGSWLDASTQLKFEKAYNTSLANVINSVITKSGLNLNAIKYIVPHNVNIHSWKNCIQRLQIDPSKVYLENISKYGHCFAADNFINLNCLLNENKLQQDDYFILVTVGLGAIYVASLFKV